MTPEQKAQAKAYLQGKVERLNQAIEDNDAYIKGVGEMVAVYLKDQEQSVQEAAAQKEKATTELSTLTALIATL